MFSRLLFTIATAISLTGLYAVYAVAIRPLVVIPDQLVVPPVAIDRADLHRPAENVRIAKTFLSDQPWTAESEYMLRAGQAFIFTRDWDRDGNDPRKVKFTPFAIVWLSTDKQGREQAISLASESAQLMFASILDDKHSTDPGRVIRAVLSGDVKVRGTEGLAIDGKQFIFDESAPSLYTNNPVRFQFGAHKGSGGRMHMSLIPAEGAPGKDRPHILGVRTIRLAGGVDRDNPKHKFEYVQFDLQQEKTLEKTNKPQKPARIRCSGDLVYDLERQTAVFSDKVVASLETDTGEFDYINCDSLAIHFTPQHNERSSANLDLKNETNHSIKPHTKNSYRHIESDLAFEKLIAKGKEVKVISQKREVKVLMTELTYHAPSRNLRMTAPQRVVASQKGSILEVPDIELCLDQGNPTDLICRGPGELNVTQPTAFTASWAKQLTWKRSPESNNRSAELELVELEQKASFRQPEKKLALGAEVIRIWLTSVFPDPEKSAAGTKSSNPDVKRLLAETNVALVSPQLQANAKEELDIRLEEFSLESDSQVDQVSSTTDHSDAVHGLRSRKDGSKSSGSTTTDHGLFSAEPFELSANKIGVKLRKSFAKAEPEVSSIEAVGRFRLHQKHKTGEEPTDVTGDRMLLVNNGPLQQVVHLFGSPAHVRDRGLHIEGHEVNFDRKANRVWVPGRGLLRLPMDGQLPVEWLANPKSKAGLDVWWDESMEFNGLSAAFVGRVRAELGRTRMSKCGQMVVELVSHQSFSDSDASQKPELRSIHCRENVEFDSSAYQETQMVKVFRGKVSEFTIDRIKDVTSAQGPGKMELWQRGKNERNDGLGPRNVIQVNRPITVLASDWNYTRVEFKGRMEGKIDLQRSRFEDSVRIIHGPVKLPNEKIDSDNLPVGASSMRCENGELMNHPKSTRNVNPYQQLVGTGNVEIEGHGFYANADEVSFDGSKNLYTLRAHGNHNATISHESSKNQGAGRSIRFILSTKGLEQLIIDGATGASNAR